MKLIDILESPAERLVRSENKGNKRISNRIKEIRAKEKAGLISQREAENSINKMSKSQKELKR